VLVGTFFPSFVIDILWASITPCSASSVLISASQQSLRSAQRITPLEQFSCACLFTLMFLSWSLVPFRFSKRSEALLVEHSTKSAPDLCFVMFLNPLEQIPENYFWMRKGDRVFRDCSASPSTTRNRGQTSNSFSFAFSLYSVSESESGSNTFLLLLGLWRCSICWIKRFVWLFTKRPAPPRKSGDRCCIINKDHTTLIISALTQHHFNFAQGRLLFPKLQKEHRPRALRVTQKAKSLWTELIISQDNLAPSRKQTQHNEVACSDWRNYMFNLFCCLDIEENGEHL